MLIITSTTYLYNKKQEIWKINGHHKMMKKQLK